MCAVLPERVPADQWSLRRLSLDDVDDLFAHFADSEVTKYLDFETLTTRDEAAEIVRWANDLFERGRGIRWGILDGATGEFIGTCGFNEIVQRHGSRAEVAFDLVRSHWGRGVMRAVLPRLLGIAFGDLGLHRVQAFVTPGNDRSVRLLERHGFRHEGRLRSYGQWRGALWDQDVYAILADEYGEV